MVFLPPLAAQFIRKKQSEMVDKIGNFLANTAYEIIRNYGMRHDMYEYLEGTWSFIVAAFPRILNSKNSHLQMVVSRFTPFLDNSGRWDDLLWVNNQAERRAIKVNDFYNAGWRAYRSGFVYYARDQVEETLDCALRAEKHWECAGVREKAMVLS